MNFQGRRGLSIIEAGERIGCGRSKIYDLLRTGALRARKVGTRTVILAEDCDAFLDALPTVSPKGRTGGSAA